MANEDIYDETPIDSDKVETKQTTFDLDEDLPTLRVGGFIRRDRFTDITKVVILDVSINQFGKPCMLIENKNEGIMGTINITNKIFEDLKRQFGSKKKDIVGKIVYLNAVPYEEIDRQGNKLQGYTLQVTFNDDEIN